MKKSLERCRSAGFQPATPLNSIEAGKMLALLWASRRLFHQPARRIIQRWGPKPSPTRPSKPTFPPGADLF